MSALCQKRTQQDGHSDPCNCGETQTVGERVRPKFERLGDDARDQFVGGVGGHPWCLQLDIHANEARSVGPAGHVLRHNKQVIAAGVVVGQDTPVSIAVEAPYLRNAQRSHTDFGSVPACRAVSTLNLGVAAGRGHGEFAVSETADETFRWRSRNCFTRSVETSRSTSLKSWPGKSGTIVSTVIEPVMRTVSAAAARCPT